MAGKLPMRYDAMRRRCHGDAMRCDVCLVIRPADEMRYDDVGWAVIGNAMRYDDQHDCPTADAMRYDGPAGDDMR